MVYGAIEAGGTKFVCAISSDGQSIAERVSIATTQPEETMAQVYQFFDQFKLTAMGIGSFGPIDSNPSSAQYGQILSTPKQGWSSFDFLGAVKKRYSIPVAWTTDVNAAAYGEAKNGSAQDVEHSIYLTVGTGIGGGFVSEGVIKEGIGHAEMGHIFVAKHEGDYFDGICPFHKGCLEGLASGSAISARYQKKAQELTLNQEVWELEAFYLAQAVYNYSLLHRPERIILGGGVMKQKQLYHLIQAQVDKLNQTYISLPDLASYVVAPALGDNAGIIGCLILAQEQIKLSN
ncbi:fructokinase [Amphibacillus marinus]|uniref:fructokinase n=1 Tax=Amphibacillus marinus TaxID=872970 RepID=A0A1H8RBE2_9BACI|nr:ROK family protein [Amphibacillus marinus]SEO63464.1 fructokinase [Amphibacillus marinus]